MGLIGREGFPIKGSFKGSKGSAIGFQSIAALKTRIGFGGILYYNYHTESQNHILILKALH